MKKHNLEKKIYECLGVNIFRKYILFSWEKICGLLDFDPDYRVEDRTINGLKRYKDTSKAFAISHLITMIITVIVLSVIKASLGIYITNCLIHSYCIMTQRYIHIRINELIERLEKREQKNRIKQQQDTKSEQKDISLTQIKSNKQNELDKNSNLEQLYAIRELLYQSQNEESKNSIDSFDKSYTFKI